MKLKRKSKAKDPDLDADSVETLIWTCSACGAENPDSKQSCIACGGDRAGDSAVPKVPEKPEPLDDERVEADVDLHEPPLFSVDDEEEKESSKPVEPEFKPEPAPPPPSPEPFTFSSPFASSANSAPFAQAPSAPSTGQGRYYIVFVNTPAQSLIKSKVPIEFDDFPVISIGRGPENVIVIPDLEVSRKHAELTRNGGRVMLKDLNSKNGTFLYNGKEFQRVSDSVEVKPNNIVKFGTGTIVRLTSE